MEIKFSGADISLTSEKLIKEVFSKIKYKKVRYLELYSSHGNLTNLSEYIGRNKIWIITYSFPRDADCKILTHSISQLTLGKVIKLPRGISDSSTPGDLSCLEKLGGKILTDDKGQAFGYVNYNVVWLFFDLPHNLHEGDNNGISVEDYKFLLEKLAVIIEKNVRTVTKKELEEICIKGFIRHSNSSIKKVMESIESRIDNRKDIIKEACRTVSENTRSIMFEKKELEALENIDIKKKIIDVVRNLNKMEGVEKIKFGYNFLEVITCPLFIENDYTYGIRYDIGRYSIKFMTDNKLVIKSVDSKNKDCRYEHPHIDGGLVCLGSAMDVQKMIGTYDYDASVVVLIKFLQSYNPGDAYITIETWFTRFFECKSDMEYEKKHGDL